MRKTESTVPGRNKLPTGGQGADAVSSSTRPVGAADTEIFIGRQPILNSDQKLFAYELLFRSSAQAGVAGVTDGVQATSRLVINTFNNFGVERVLGDKKAFINVSAPLLESDLLELLPADKVVLEVLEDVPPTAETVSRCQALRALGYKFALDDFVYKRELESFLSIASFIKFDLRALGVSGLSEQLRLLRGRGISFIVEKVETRSEFDSCRALLINYYQGYYFAKPQTLRMKRMDPSTQQLMHLFSLVSANAEPQVIDANFRQNVALSYNLLRYINSVGFGLMHKVDTIKHALVLLGHAKLARWLTLLMFSSSGSNPAPQALFRTALIRARLTELLGQKRLPAAEHDHLFMCGMFSLLDAMLDTPLVETLKNLSLPDKVSSALLSGQGAYAPYLALSCACEEGDPARLQTLAGPLGLGLDDLSRLQIDAMGWAEEVASAGGG
jgi:EAL and modified HD-GYP domain-containing signal transduction protein